MNSHFTMDTRWGIVGSGRISHDFVKCVNSILFEGHQVVAVAARSLKSAQQFAQNHKITKAYGSYEELSKDPDVEVVYIGNLFYQHYSVARMMLQAGKHVLCEKTMCMNLDQTQRLIKCARKNKRFLMEGIWSRFFPAYDQLRVELKNGTIGEPQLLQVNFGLPMTTSERVITPSQGGSAALEIGIYILQIASLVFGAEKPIKITASGFLDEQGADESATIVLLYSNHRMAVMTYTTRLTLNNQAVITGTSGVMKIPDRFWCPTQLVTPTIVYNFKLPRIDGPFSYGNSEGLTYEAREVRKCLQDGFRESPILPLSESEVLSSILTEVHKQLGVTFPPSLIE